MFGPPVLLGGLVAAGLWFSRPAPPWRQPEVSDDLIRQGAGPISEAPVTPLPKPGPAGTLAGLESGWSGTIHKALIGATLESNVLPKTLGRFTLPPGPINVAKVIAAGPSTGLFVGAQEGFLIARERGCYEVAIRLHRSSYEAANCVTRLSFGAHRVLSRYDTNMIGESELNSNPIAFGLMPGACRVALVFGCWRDDQMTGPGDLTLMIRHPNETAASPARPDDIWRPAAQAD